MGVLGYHRNLMVISLHLETTNVLYFLHIMGLYECIDNLHEFKKQVLWYVNINTWSTVELITHQDDEYVWAGVEDPKVVITTSHNPSSRLKQFAKVSDLLLCV